MWKINPSSQIHLDVFSNLKQTFSRTETVISPDPSFVTWWWTLVKMSLRRNVTFFARWQNEIKRAQNLNKSILILGGWCRWRWVHQLWRICENIYFAENLYAEIDRLCMLPYNSCLKIYSERLILTIILRISSLQVAMMQSAGHYSKVDGGWTWSFLCAIFQVILT